MGRAFASQGSAGWYSAAQSCMETTSSAIVAPMASLANKGRMESLLSRLGSDSQPLDALQMLAATSTQPTPTVHHHAPVSTNRRKRASDALSSIDREASSSEGGLMTEGLPPQGDETALQRAKKMQEKNKRAQARYRQRQRVRALPFMRGSGSPQSSFRYPSVCYSVSSEHARLQALHQQKPLLAVPSLQQL